MRRATAAGPPRRIVSAWAATMPAAERAVYLVDAASPPKTPAAAALFRCHAAPLVPAGCSSANLRTKPIRRRREQRHDDAG